MTLTSWSTGWGGDGDGGEVQGGDVAEGHRGADGGPGAGVAVPHHGGAGVPGRVQADDRGAVRAQDPGPFVGAQPALGAQIAGDQLGGVEGWLEQRTDA